MGSLAENRDVTSINNNIIETDIGGAVSSTDNNNENISLICKEIPRTKIQDIQSIVLYNRTIYDTSARTIGLVIELYNRDIDPNLETPLASTAEITTGEDVYRFDFPAIDTYPSGDFSDTNSITQIASETLALKEVVSEFAESPNITGGLTVDTITTTGNENVGGIILAPNQVSFRAGPTTSQSTINTSIVLPFDNVIYNNGDAYNNSDYEFTAPVSGIYFFYSQFFTNSNNSYGADYLLYDGTTETVSYRIEQPSGGGGGTKYVPASFTTQLNSGDKVKYETIFRNY